jgi:hypothetical protein
MLKKQEAGSEWRNTCRASLASCIDWPAIEPEQSTRKIASILWSCSLKSGTNERRATLLFSTFD